MFIEVSFSGYLYAVRIAAEITGVEIHGDDLFLGKVLFQLNGNDPLFCFLDDSSWKPSQLGEVAVEFRVNRVKVLSKLLRDCTAATLY